MEKGHEIWYMECKEAVRQVLLQQQPGNEQDVNYIWWYTGDQVGQGGTVRAGDYILYMEKETEITNWEHDFLYTTE